MRTPRVSTVTIEDTDPATAASGATPSGSRGDRDDVLEVWRSRIAVARESRAWMWGAFAFVHLAIAAAVLSFDGYHLGDVHTAYVTWAQHAFTGNHDLVGIDSSWVYPIGALVPILLPMLFGQAAYGVAWVAMVTALNAGALLVLTRRRIRARWTAAWWWLGFMLLLGPISLVRLDTVSVPIAIVALVWLTTRPRVAIVLLTIATWIKVWPAVLLASVLVLLRRRMRTLAISLITSAAIVAVPLALGAGTRILSFVGMQDARGLQIESPVASGWLWAAAFHVRSSHVFYSSALNTFEVTGPGARIAAELMTPLLAVAVVVVLALGIRAAVLKDAGELPTLMLSLVLALILFDKVLSPQYITWLAAPVVFGLVQNPRRFRYPALLALAIAALTQSFYPWLYHYVVVVNPGVLELLAARNVALCALFAWTILELWRAKPAVRPQPRYSARPGTPAASSANA
ncbi:DUF2029 domain-containing protein [Planctomonas sp. JC2975]|uniref:glycosyltransferase family 87 protein n=1 Tax=Planctomonas sp. JC2975 TaxID=2729626 RepID=UPI0014746518|nr:glycosyltransferase family 87 protein [Planctomonas sp. JC2975]NNC11551.1 DUF2029 domain-containing protein [Planctomonas sp. JC2975]